jgi:hypothetical protein
MPAPALLQYAAESNNAETQNGSCAFLQLQPETLHLVLQALEPQHRLVLTLTCRALHGLHATLPLLRKPAPDAGPTPRVSRLHCSQPPGAWVCEVCLALHPLDPLDTPENP